MAINFLNTIDLNKNSLDNARIQNLGSDPAGAVEGQIYFNTTDDVLKIYGGGVWSEVGGGVESLVATNSGTTYVSLTPTSAATGAVTITADLNATALTGSIDNTKYLRGDNKWASVTSIYGWTLQGDNATTTSITNGLAVDIAGGTNVTTALVGTILTINATDTNDNDYLTGLGFNVGNGVLTATVQNQASVTVDLDGRYLELAGGTMTGSIAMGSNSITGLSNPTNAQDAATKAYVDTSVTGLLQFISGFNASTGAIVSGGNLTSGATRVAVAVGDYYVVTVAGDFFGNALTPLTPGDSVIVQTAAVAGASSETDFIVVQSDTDLATNSTVGLMTINPTGVGGITSNIVNGVATITNADTNSANTATGTIAAGQTSGTVTHAFGINTIVQTINSSGDTVFCDITRTATTSVATIAVVEATDITILVQKIG